MQIRKCLLAVCFAVAAALSVQAADTDAQVKAREALQQKLKEIDAQAATNAPAVTNAPAPAPAEPVPPAAAAATAAAVAAAPATTQVNGVPTPADPAQIEKARESMRKKMEEVTAAELAADAEAQRRAMAQNPEAPPSKPKQPTSLDLPPMDAPPLPISADKKQRLDVLLSRYRADQITPDQYQAERAKILQGD
jgi:hypothetical protein